MNIFFDTTHNIKFYLKNILHVSNGAKNLLNVSQFTKYNFVYMKIYHESCFVKEKLMAQMFLQAKVNYELYSFQLSLDSRRNKDVLKAR